MNKKVKVGIIIACLLGLAVVLFITKPWSGGGGPGGNGPQLPRPL